MTRYQTEKIDDPRQVDVEDYIRERLGLSSMEKQYQPGPRQAMAQDIPEYMTVGKQYAPLREVLDRAFEQAAFGKGKERHANDKPFLQQPIMEITRMHGIGFVTGQAAKKAQEAVGMVGRKEFPAAHREILGAIVYLAAAYLRVNEVAEESGVDDTSSVG